jgi:TonB family protein
MAKNENAIPGGERSAIKRLLTVILLLLTFDLTNARAQSGSPLENAKAMYDSASFDEALTVLDRLNRTQPETDVEEVQRYRALCLLALNRTTEAENAIEVVFSRDPLYKLSDGDAPPRMRAAFTDVRRRLLPKVTEQLYAAAKLSFERQEYPLAATQFQDLLSFLEDADVRELPSLKEFRMLATGFRDLSVAAPAAAAKPGPQPVPAAPAATVQTAAGPDSSGVLQPPVIVRQQMPLWLGMKEFAPRGSRGMLRVIIDEHGDVEEARVVESVHAIYDALVVSAARTWKYEPAKLDGRPVRYGKLIEIVLKPVQ